MFKVRADIVNVRFSYSVSVWITYLGLSDTLSSSQDQAVVVKSI